ncbi:hypothetical protein TRIP_E370072 [uncultured Spirochaetota bacterium]|jgi:hypothetical protein|nr:hypothetical protein TRIP_E370072 [uncultured Spirochaetota bacterium]
MKGRPGILERLAQLDRASASGAEGRAFESRIAQSRLSFFFGISYKNVFNAPIP